jgi:haloacetate dehalogenase
MLFPGFKEMGFKEMTVPGKGAEISLMTGGQGPSLLLLHGYPQTRAMWHRVAPALARHFTLIIPDLRGYGDSAKPASDAEHYTYSKRATGQDMIEVMARLGHERFFVAGHDRGGRVGHRMGLDYPEQIKKLAVLDIVPTRKMFESVNQEIATGYYHWFFLIQAAPYPERMIGHDPDYYLRSTLERWSGGGLQVFDAGALDEYARCFRDPSTIHASCEDYRAGASIDLEHDRADGGRKLDMPVLAIWGERGLIHRRFDVPAAWRERASDVRGQFLPCGHFPAEEAPQATAQLLLDFFKD